MKALTLSKRAFSQLERYQLDPQVTSTECELFLLPTKARWKKEEQLLKKLYIDEGETFSNKLFTLNTLLDQKDNIAIEQIVFPNQLAIVDKQVVGFTMPLIPNTQTLFTILNDYNVPIKRKLYLLKQVAQLLNKIQMTTEGFFLGDIHESNFIVDNNDQVYAVDLDSCKIGRNLPFPAKYLSLRKGLQTIKNKYVLHENGLIIPSYETEWFCFNMMVLNTIAHGPIYQLSQKEYYTYLQFLSDKGFDKPLLDCLSSLYTAQSNTSSAPYLDTINGSTGEVNYHVFQHRLKKTSAS